MIPLLPLAMLLLEPESHRRWTLPLALALLVAGESLRVWAVSFAGRITRTRTTRLTTLVTDGPFQFVRNPLYVANILIAVGVTLLFDRPTLAPLVGLLTALYYDLIVAFEEQLLRHKFGAEFMAYCDTVPRWLPRLSPAAPGSGPAPVLREALFSERGTFGTLALLFIGGMVVRLLP